MQYYLHKKKLVFFSEISPILYLEINGFFSVLFLYTLKLIHFYTAPNIQLDPKIIKRTLGKKLYFTPIQTYN